MKAAKPKPRRCHFQTESPGFGGAMCWDTMCGAELWPILAGISDFMSEDAAKVTCEECQRIMKRRNRVEAPKEGE